MTSFLSILGQDRDRSPLPLHEASNLVAELEKSFEERTQTLGVLRQEVERYSQLCRSERRKGECYFPTARIIYKQAEYVKRWVSLAINLFAGLILFILGLFLGPLITSWLGWG